MRLIDADELRIKPEYMHNICGTAMIRVEDISRIINEMPPIEPQPQWIPCSDRTPNYPNGSETYWCSTCKCDVHAEEYIVMIKGAVLPTALFWDGYHWFDVDGNSTLYPVVAWMPFPEPYKGDVTE